MKKLLLSVTVFLSVFSVNVFAQGYTESEAYKKGVEYYDQANTNQVEGQYINSYDLASLAAEELNMVITGASEELLTLYKANIAQAKEQADASIKKAQDIGANVGRANSSYNSAVQAEGLIGTFEGDIDKENANYTASLDNFNKANTEASGAYSIYVAQQTSEAQNLITQANTKYNSLLRSNIIKKGDANDSAISKSISDANASLKALKFAEAKNQANAANASMTKLEQDNAAKIAEAKKVVDDATKKYNGFLANKTIIKNDDDDKNVSNLLKEANASLAKNDAVAATSGANKANEALNEIQNRKTSMAQEAIDNANKKRSQFISDGIIEENDDDDKNVTGIIARASDALSKSDTATAATEANNASTTLDDIEARKEKERQEALLITTASIEEQLQKIRQMVADLVENETLDPNSQEVANINAVIDRIKTSLEQGNISEQTVSEAQESVEELVETVDGVVEEVVAEGTSNVLPKYYVVREITPVDSLWNISAYSFVYGNAIYWELLYNANRNLLTDPENPHIIIPGQVIEIPSLDGETREGVYSPDIEYIVE